MDQFAAATEDEPWIHVDPVRAQSGPYKSAIVHGFLSLSLVSAMLWEIYAVEDLDVQINYGTGKVRFPAPLWVGEQVRATAELLEVTPGAKGARVRTLVTIKSETVAKPICVAETVVLLVPKQTATTGDDSRAQHKPLPEHFNGVDPRIQA